MSDLLFDCCSHFDAARISMMHAVQDWLAIGLIPSFDASAITRASALVVIPYVVHNGLLRVRTLRAAARSLVTRSRATFAHERRDHKYQRLVIADAFAAAAVAA